MSFQDYSSFKGIFKSSLFSSSQLLGSGFLSDHVGSSSEDEMNSLYGSNATSKKRRLSIQQVRCLESSFEEESKLEPEKKMQLAADLGLQPRQVAIWFQNRRARWKTKQLERDYDELKQNYDTLLSEKEELQLQVAGLTQELQELKGRQKEKEEMEVEIDYRSNATTSPFADKNDEEEEEEAQVKENAKGVSKTKTTRVTSEELQSLSPSFCSDTDSNPGNLRSSDTACHCHCHCHCHLSSMFDYLIMDHSESDWLATFP